MDKKFKQENSLEFQDEEIVFREGDESFEMYVVQEGRIGIYTSTSAGEVLLAEIKKGDFVGEMSLLESLPRSATARSHGKSKLLSIQPGGFLLKIRRDPTFAFEILQALSRRIRTTNQKLLAEFEREGLGTEKIKIILQTMEQK